MKTYQGFESLPHRHIKENALDASQGRFLLYRWNGREALTGFDKTTGLVFWTAKGGPQGERQDAASQSPPPTHPIINILKINRL
ncbi:hypothetical protein ABRQ03_02395 [Pectobacterium jejuense]|uniref:hypothetical protein n=1 Tax=Pectobacterium jejuense TaxID=2974022 RepID=UPI0032EC771B